MNHPSLASRVFSNTFYSIVDVLLLKASTILAFVLLVRFLPGEDIAAIGIATGYLIFIQYLDVGPIRVLLRDYPRIADDRQQRDRLLTALFAFWGMQAIAMFFVAGLLILFVFEPMSIKGISFLFAAMALDFLALTLHGWVKVIYYADLQQRIAIRISLVIGVLRFSSYTMLLLYPGLHTYSIILAAVAILGSAIWIFAFQRRFDFHPVWTRTSPQLLMRSLADYGLWDHFNRVVIDTLFAIDLVILSWFAGLRDIGNYTVALKFASLLTLIPAQLTAALQVTSAKVTDAGKRGRIVNSFLKMNWLVSLAQFVVILVLGRWLMTILFGAEATAGALNYAMIIAGAVTVFNLTYPIIGIINNFCSIRLAFLVVFLPGLIFGIASYTLSGALYGALGMAWANVIAYAGLAMALGMFVKHFHPIAWQWTLITSEESATLKAVFLRRGGK